MSFEDVTEATMVATALRRQALHDGLTGLPNRTLLRDRLHVSLTDARRRQERVALILLDLNHFKDVNDALGHQYGDRLLIAFSRRLQSLLRECDTIARLGGDEFALLLTDATTEGASRWCSKVTEAMQEPFEIEGITLQTKASIGVALFPDHAEDADLLTQRADVAMYNAKRGGGGWRVYSPPQDQSTIERLTLLSDLHHQLDDDRPDGITLHYQPIVDLASDSHRRRRGAAALGPPGVGAAEPRDGGRARRTDRPGRPPHALRRPHRASQASAWRMRRLRAARSPPTCRRATSTTATWSAGCRRCWRRRGCRPAASGGSSPSRRSWTTPCWRWT